MLSYQHIYHAGNFADIQKHALLVLLLRSLRMKPQPVVLLDTHAGRGMYALDSAEAEKTREYDNGIAHIYKFRKDQSPMKPFFELLAGCNDTDAETVTRYPGSAYIARQLMKPSDKLVATELHPGEFNILQNNFAGVKNADILNEDGLKKLSGIDIPAGARFIAVIDPSYEIKSDYQEVPKHIVAGLRKRPQAIYFLWYPVLPDAPHLTMLADLKKSGIPDILVSEIYLPKPPQDHYRMYGSGVAIINPPFPEAIMGAMTRYVADHLPKKAESKIYWVDNMTLNEYTGKLED